MAIDPLSVSVMALLAPYLKSGAESFAKEAGKEACETAKTLFGTIKNRMGKKTAESFVVKQFEEDPENAKPVFAGALSEKIAEDHEFAGELRRILSEFKGGTALNNANHGGHIETVYGDKSTVSINSGRDSYYNSPIRLGKNADSD